MTFVQGPPPWVAGCGRWCTVWGGLHIGGAHHWCAQPLLAHLPPLLAFPPLAGVASCWHATLAGTPAPFAGVPPTPGGVRTPSGCWHAHPSRLVGVPMAPGVPPLLVCPTPQNVPPPAVCCPIFAGGWANLANRPNGGNRANRANHANRTNCANRANRANHLLEGFVNFSWPLSTGVN